MIYWLIWPIGITLWLAIGWTAFFYFEAKGLHNKHESVTGYITLSYFIYTLTKKMPLLIFLIGLAVGLFWGGLAVHLWAHWCPPGSVSTGLLKQQHLVLDEMPIDVQPTVDDF